MVYYENEILHELIIGQQYTQKQLGIFIAENSGVTIISKSCGRFLEYSQSNHMVIDIIEGYEHKGELGTYKIPSQNSKVYIVD